MHRAGAPAWRLAIFSTASTMWVSCSSASGSRSVTSRSTSSVLAGRSSLAVAASGLYVYSSEMDEVGLDFL